jgi:adenylate cyclase
MGGTYVRAWIFQWSDDPQSLERALDLTQQAIALDPSLRWFHGGLGSVYLWKKQHDRAIAEAERAIAPQEPDAYVTLAQVLNYAGQPEKALGLVEKALRLNPQKPGWYSGELGWTYQLLGQHEQAIATLRNAIGQFPQNPRYRTLLAVSYSEVGREAEARAEATELLRLNPHYSVEVDRQRLRYRDPAALERHLAALRKAGLK